MRVTAFCMVVALAGAAFAAGQQEPEAQAPDRRAFRLDLRQLGQPGYGPARELRLALFDSPMSRLELAMAHEQWALRNPGPTGIVVPFQMAPLRARLQFDSTVQPLLFGPWSPGWDRLTWQEKVGAGAQTSFIVWTLVQMVHHAP